MNALLLSILVSSTKLIYQRGWGKTMGCGYEFCIHVWPAVWHIDYVTSLLLAAWLPCLFQEPLQAFNLLGGLLRFLPEVLHGLDVGILTVLEVRRHRFPGAVDVQDIPEEA